MALPWDCSWLEFHHGLIYSISALFFPYPRPAAVEGVLSHGGEGCHLPQAQSGHDPDLLLALNIIPIQRIVSILVYNMSPGGLNSTASSLSLLCLPLVFLPSLKLQLFSPSSIRGPTFQPLYSPSTGFQPSQDRQS
jgi:hypothetical protein